MPKRLADLDVTPQVSRPHTPPHAMHGPCRITGCGTRLDGDDRLCGYHRALQAGKLPEWQAGQSDWRDRLFAEFRDRHRADTWGALCRASLDLRSDEDRRELLAHLRRAMPKLGALPYDPTQREAA